MNNQNAFSSQWSRSQLRRGTRPRDIGQFTSTYITKHYSDNVDSVGNPNQEELSRIEDSSRNDSAPCPTTWLNNSNLEATPRGADIRQCSRPNHSKGIGQDLVPCRQSPISIDMSRCERLGLWQSKNFSVHPATAAQMDYYGFRPSRGSFNTVLPL